MNKFILSSVLVGVLAVSSLAFAEGNVPTATNVPGSSSVRAKIQEQKDKLKEEADNARAALKTEVRDKRAEVEKEIRALKDDIKTKTQEFKDTVKAKRAELEDKIKTKREELQTNLKKIKDATKQKTVEKIDQQVDDLNARMMAHFSDMLDKLSAVLVRIGDRADKASQQGYDVSSVRTAINDANKAIDSARSAVAAQTGKTYTINITTENGLKGAVKKVRDALHADLTAVKNSVQAANQAVRKAAVALGQLRGQSPSPSVLPSESPSPSVSPTPTQ